MGSDSGAGLRTFAPTQRPAVQVRHRDEGDDGGRWHPGQLHAWMRSSEGAWSALVLYSAGPGYRFYRWVPGVDVRPVSDRDNDDDHDGAATDDPGGARPF